MDWRTRVAMLIYYGFIVTVGFGALYVFVRIIRWMWETPIQ